MTGFTPILYVKASCPHCLKLRLFLLEAGLAGHFEVRVFEPGDDAEAPIRAELTPRLARVTFPAAQVAPGRYLQDSDLIIAHFAQAHGIDPAALPLFSAYAGSVLPRYLALRREIARQDS